MISPSEIDIVLTPLEAVDRQGRRLGKGGGFYDRFLAETTAVSVGVALTHQVVDAVPTTAFDVPLQACCTPEGILHFNDRSI